MPTVPCRDAGADASGQAPGRRPRHLALVRADVAVASRGDGAEAPRRSCANARRARNPQLALARRGPTPGDRRPSTPRPRVTRRGRQVAVVLLAGLLLTAFSLGRASAVDKGPGSPTASVVGHGASMSRAVRIIVQPGDTLWSIAQRTAPRSDPRVAIERLRRANGMVDSRLATGSVLVVPSLR